MSSLFRHSNYFGQNNFNWALSLQKYLLNQKADYGFVYAAVAEWLNAPVLKIGNPAMDSKVQILPAAPVLKFVYLSAEPNSNG